MKITDEEYRYVYRASLVSLAGHGEDYDVISGQKALEAAATLLLRDFAAGEVSEPTDETPLEFVNRLLAQRRQEVLAVEDPREEVLRRLLDELGVAPDAELRDGVVVRGLLRELDAAVPR